jgi:hypothetical protein
MNRRSVVEAWLALYGQSYMDENPDLFVSLFTDDALYWETPFMEPVHAADFHRFWSDLAKRSTGRAIDFDVLHVEDSTALVHWTATNTQRATGERREGSGIFRLTFSSNNKCRLVEEWQHWHVVGSPLERGWPWT